MLSAYLIDIVNRLMSVIISPSSMILLLMICYHRLAHYHLSISMFCYGFKSFTCYLWSGWSKVSLVSLGRPPFIRNHLRSSRHVGDYSHARMATLSLPNSLQRQGKDPAYVSIWSVKNSWKHLFIMISHNHIVISHIWHITCIQVYHTITVSR